jgi:hypothetical protein
LSYRIAYTSVRDVTRAANSAPKNATFSRSVEPPCTDPGGASKNPRLSGRGSAACSGVSFSRRSSRAFSARNCASSAATDLAGAHSGRPQSRPPLRGTWPRRAADQRARLARAIAAPITPRGGWLCVVCALCAETADAFVPRRAASKGLQPGVQPAQYGCAARDLNPEPAD